MQFQNQLQNRFKNHFLAILGHSVFVVLLVLATVFYKERMVYCDTALYVYQLIQTKTSLIAHDRFIDIIPQFFVVLAIKSNLSLKSVLLIYSWSLILFAYATFIYCWHFLKSHAFSLVALMVCIGFYTHAFYWCSSELQLGVQASVMLWATLYERKSLANLSVFELVVVYGSIPFIVFSHPLILLTTGFAIAFFFLNKQEMALESRFFYSIIALFGAVFLFKMKFMPVESYEVEASSWAIDRFKQNWYKALFVPSTRDMLKSFFLDYYLLLLLPICFAYYYIKNKNWLKLALVLGTTFALFSLFQASYPSDAKVCYIENGYVTIAFCLALPLAIDYLPNLKMQPRSLMTIIAIICVLRLVNITLAHRIYTDRITWIEETINKGQTSNQSRFILNSTDVPATIDKTTFNWGITYESLLLSALKAPGLATSIYIETNQNSHNWILSKDNVVLLQYDIIEHKDLNQNYFKFAKGSYVFINKNGVIK